MATTSTTYLRLTFTAGAKDFIIRVPDPKVDLTVAEIEAAAANIIARNVFHGTDGDLVALKDARVISTSTNDMI